MKTEKIFKSIIKDVINGNKKEASVGFYYLQPEDKREFMTYLLMNNAFNRNELNNILRSLFVADMVIYQE